MKKSKKLHIAAMAAVSIGCFFIGRNTADQPKPETHVERMGYALENISYWELDENGKDVLVYDYDGNVYKW